MNFVDRMLLLWHDQQEMAASSPAGFLLFTFMCFPLGTAAYANTFVAQYDGSGNPRRIGLAVWQAIFLAFLTAPIFLLLTPVADSVFQWGNHSPQLLQFEHTYFHVLASGAGPTICSAAIASFFTGRGRSKTVMLVDGGAAVLNIMLDATFIFGVGFIPEMGIAGAALATALSQSIKMCVYFWLFFMPAENQRFGVKQGLRWDSKLFARLLYFGSPEGLRMATEMTALTGFLIFLGRLGDEELAATTLAFNLNTIGFVPLMGMGIAVSTLVGQCLGKNNVELATRATHTALALALMYTAMMAVLYVGLPDLLLAGHAAGTGANAKEYQILRDSVVVLLRFVAAYGVLDAIFIIYLSAIKGAGDTRFVLIASLILAPIPFCGAWAVVHYLDWGLYGCWMILTLWVTLNGLIYAVRFTQGKWQTMRVIEPELL